MILEPREKLLFVSPTSGVVQLGKVAHESQPGSEIFRSLTLTRSRIILLIGIYVMSSGYGTRTCQQGKMTWQTNKEFEDTQDMMSFMTLRGFFVLVCVGILASQPCMVSGQRSKDLALRWDHKQSPLARIARVVKGVAMEDLQSQLELAPAPSMTFDPNQSNKRTVRKGSDPIHNRYSYAKKRTNNEVCFDIKI
ncbi:CLAVATA3/ESR (CLE)-related protein 45 [Glycine soja]